MSTTTLTRIGAGAAALALLTGAALAAPAAAKDGADDTAAKLAADDSTNRTVVADSTTRTASSSRARVVKRGSCTAASDWKLKAKARDGRIEVEWEVDSNVVDQRWTYRLSHDGTTKASGSRTTKAPSGSFSVERRLPNAPGVHTIRATASNAGTGETCSASLAI